MACDYRSIRAQNEKRYGTEINRIGKLLLSDRYADRTHFIFELLQNAEDALRRRGPTWQKRSISFTLSESELRVSHFGALFTEEDVRGICGIGEGTKEQALTAIGRFGIGFKAVYAFTDCPEIHSGDEHFAIDSYVWPRAIKPTKLQADETVFVFPFREDDARAFDDIANGLQKLGARTLLFLRETDEITWLVEGGGSGTYLRSKAGVLADNARKVVLVGQDSGDEPRDETWLIFSRQVKTSEGRDAGYAELAFALAQDEGTQKESIERVSDSKLVVFFPTVVSTGLGFLVQGPYRTTPSRDNIPQADEWNRRLVSETAGLLGDSLTSLRELGYLDTNALSCLPLAREKFGADAMFAPLFEGARTALANEQLLPCYGSGHISASSAKLARTQELRELISSEQLAQIFAADTQLGWLTSDITQDRTPELRQYLMHELDIAEITPETILPKLERAFLEAQSDHWILSLYEFLGRQPALIRRLDNVPLIRLEDGNHVTVRQNGQSQAFLPGAVRTGFPTVRRFVCSTDEARTFLQSIGLTEPDPVDDVVRNVLPKYTSEEEAIDVSDQDYEADINRILKAFATDSKVQREKLVTALRESSFVMVVDAGSRRKYISPPGGLYLASERLKKLFDGVSDVLLVDDSYSCLRGEDMRELLETCGAVRYLRPEDDSSLSWEECRELRKRAGHEETSGQNDRVTDQTLVGLSSLLEMFPSLSVEERPTRASLLWEELTNLEDRRGKAVFTGEYTWTHYGAYRATFDAAFVRKLNKARWVPDANGELKCPEFVLFDSLDWKPDPFLLSKIHFKPSAVETLAQEAGIEPGVLDLLKKLGVTSEAELKERLGIKDEEEPKVEASDGGTTVEEALEDLGIGTPSGPVGSEEESQGAGTGGGGGSGGTGTGQGTWGARGTGSSKSGGGKPSTEVPTRKRGAFVSYVATHPDEEEEDPDGLRHEERMALENKAIELIMSQEPKLQRTQANNPGFDLTEPDGSGRPIRWLEVKAMKGTLEDRPVGLSATQFKSAQEHGNRYWLYVVERASDSENARIVRIQDPAGKARYFTFDHGWKAAAEVDKEPEQKG